MLRPAYRIVIGDHVVDTTAEPKASTAIDLDVRLDMDTPVDSCTLVQGQVGGLHAAPGDTMTVDLGYADGSGDDASTRVLSGLVVGVEPELETKRIVGHDAADVMLRTFVDKTFEDTTTGDVVRSLAGSAGVDVERVSDGPSLPAYVIDGRRNVMRHVRDLAILAGFDAYVTPQGKLVFEAFAGSHTVHKLKYGEHVLAAELTRGRPRAGTVEVWGESPGSARGDESWAWLTDDFGPRHGTSGSAAPILLVERSAVRTAQVAAGAASAIADTIAANAVRGAVRIQGRAQLHLGDLIRLEDFPAKAGMDELDGNYQVRSVRHRISKQQGFTTEVGFRSLVGAAAAAAGGVAG
jgi:phage protein D